MSGPPGLYRPAVALGDGRAIPQVGYAVCPIAPGPATRAAVEAALAIGYRHIDTAARYGNEAGVAAAVAARGLDPDTVWVTVRLRDTDSGTIGMRRGFEAALRRLGRDAVDLCLLDPLPGHARESWRVLERLHAEGLARSIGVSTVLVHQLDQLLAHGSVRPAVNRIEMDPFRYRSRLDVLHRCREAGVAVAAAAPLAGGHRLRHPAVRAVAGELGRTPAQVLLRWSLQKDFIALPRSTDPRHIIENADVFDFTLDTAQMARLDTLEADAGRDRNRRRDSSMDPVYEIRVRGHLGETILGAFPALRAEIRDADTLLRGPVSDQSALFGVLARIEALHLELLELHRLPRPE